MDNSNDQFVNDLVSDDGNILSNVAWSPPADFELEQYVGSDNTTEDLGNLLSSTYTSFDTSKGTPSGYSPNNDSNFEHQQSSDVVSKAVVLPPDMQANNAPLEIIAQPYYGGKLRYQSDYDTAKNRLGSLGNRNKDSSFQSPTIRIPQCYLEVTDKYFIRVSLVTIECRQTSLHYFHPYKLEHATNEQYNDRNNNAVWFPIQKEDCELGIKSFPFLRLVKSKASVLQSYGNLRVFDCHDETVHNKFLPLLSKAKNTILEYNLDQSQLAFTVGKATTVGDVIEIKLISNTTILSEPMKESEGTKSEPTADDQSTSTNQDTPIVACRVYKYAPLYGFVTTEDTMVIFLTKKLEPKTYGELQVTLECNTLCGPWSHKVDNIEIIDRMVSFKIPVCFHPLQVIHPVDVILRQEKRNIAVLKYHYVSSEHEPLTSQLRTITNQPDPLTNVSTKRAHRSLIQNDLEYDGFEPADENSHVLHSSLSEPQAHQATSTSTSQSVSLPPMHMAQTTDDPETQMINELTRSIESLFIENDYSHLFRIARSIIKRNPQILHTALINNQNDLLLKFIPLALIDNLRGKNEQGENLLHHAVRLNRADIVRALLERAKSEAYIDEVNEKKNNIFHILALHATSSDVCDLLIECLLQKSILISPKFDQVNHDQQTPLQLAVCQNNRPITKSFLKYFKTDICETKNGTGDNLVHLAVRTKDLAMVKFLIEHGQLIQLGNQSNLRMTPKELARALKLDHMTEYFKEIYPEEEIDDDEDSDED